MKHLWNRSAFDDFLRLGYMDFLAQRGKLIGFCCWVRTRLELTVLILRKQWFQSGFNQFQTGFWFFREGFRIQLLRAVYIDRISDHTHFSMRAQILPKTKTKSGTCITTCILIFLWVRWFQRVEHSWRGGFWQGRVEAVLKRVQRVSDSLIFSEFGNREGNKKKNEGMCQRNTDENCKI